jgi:hypothetical protein
LRWTDGDQDVDGTFSCVSGRIYVGRQCFCGFSKTNALGIQILKVLQKAFQRSLNGLLKVFQRSFKRPLKGLGKNFKRPLKGL